MKCYEADLEIMDLVPGLPIRFDKRRPYVMLGFLFGGGRRVYLNDELVRQVTSTGATRIFDCNLDTENWFLLPADPADQRFMVAIAHTATYSTDCVELVAADGARILMSGEATNHLGAFVELNAGASVTVTERWTRDVEGTGPNLFHWFRKAQTTTRVYVRSTLKANSAGAVTVHRGPANQEEPTYPFTYDYSYEG